MNASPERAGPDDSAGDNSRNINPDRSSRFSLHVLLKSYRFSNHFYLTSDTFPITLYYYYNTVLGVRCSTTFLTVVSPCLVNHQSEVTGDRGSPAVGPPARYCRQAGRPPGTVPERPEGSAQDRPASSGGLPPTWKTERTGRPTGRPSPAVLLRWSA